MHEYKVMFMSPVTVRYARHPLPPVPLQLLPPPTSPSVALPQFHNFYVFIHIGIGFAKMQAPFDDARNSQGCTPCQN